MNLLNIARKHSKMFTTSSGGFSVLATFTTKDESLTVEVECIHTVHHNAVDTDGIQVNAKIASIAVSEEVLTDLGYPTRGANGEVALEGHLISAPDNTGTVRNYIVREKFSDENLGIIVILLNKYVG